MQKSEADLKNQLALAVSEVHKNAQEWTNTKQQLEGEQWGCGLWAWSYGCGLVCSYLFIPYGACSGTLETPVQKAELVTCKCLALREH